MEAEIWNFGRPNVAGDRGRPQRRRGRERCGDRRKDGSEIVSSEMWKENETKRDKESDA